MAAAAWAMSRRPVCQSCMRHYLRTNALEDSWPVYMQIRGKKKQAAKPTTLNVRLLKDTQGYGGKGSIVPVAPGLFRNTWLPSGRAEYLSTYHETRPKQQTVERDFFFGKEQEVVDEETVEGNTQVNRPVSRVELLPAKRALELLEKIIPPQIIFHRKLISRRTAKTDLAGGNVLLAASQSLAGDSDGQAPPILPPSSKDTEHLELQMIFGSVSDADIVESIKALLAAHENADASKITLAVEDIRIMPPGEDKHGTIEGGNKVKALGEYAVEIRARGGEQVVRRTVAVQAMDRARGRAPAAAATSAAM